MKMLARKFVVEIQKKKKTGLDMTEFLRQRHFDETLRVLSRDSPSGLEK